MAIDFDIALASHARYIVKMRSATIPPLRVAPEFRSQIESVLTEGETLSSLVEHSIRQEVNRRVTENEFHRRGFEAIAHAERTGVTVPADVVIAKLEAKVLAARARLAGR